MHTWRQIQKEQKICFTSFFVKGIGVRTPLQSKRLVKKLPNRAKVKLATGRIVGLQTAEANDIHVPTVELGGFVFVLGQGLPKKPLTQMR
jgi:hypothetical protein